MTDPGQPGKRDSRAEPAKAGEGDGVVRWEGVGTIEATGDRQCGTGFQPVRTGWKPVPHCRSPVASIVPTPSHRTTPSPSPAFAGSARESRFPGCPGSVIGQNY